MSTLKPNTNPELLVKNMLIEDRADTIAYIRDKLTLNDLRTATQNLQAVCNIVHQILSNPNPNIVDAYKISNFVATGFHDNIDIFQEIKRDSIESHKGHISVPMDSVNLNMAYHSESHKGHISVPMDSVNLNMAYHSEKLKGNKSEYLVKAIANMLEILNLTAHILSREKLLLSSSKYIIVANTILSTALYKPCKDIVSSTDMRRIWDMVVHSAKDVLVGPSETYITMGEHRVYHGYNICFTPEGIFVDGEDYINREMETVQGMIFCTLWFNPISAWVYFNEKGMFGIQPKDNPRFDLVGSLDKEDLAKSLYRELVA